MKMIQLILTKGKIKGKSSDLTSLSSSIGSVLESDKFSPLCIRGYGKLKEEYKFKILIFDKNKICNVDLNFFCTLERLHKLKYYFNKHIFRKRFV